MPDYSNNNRHFSITVAVCWFFSQQQILLTPSHTQRLARPPVEADVEMCRPALGCDQFWLLKGQSGHVGAMKTAINEWMRRCCALLEKNIQLLIRTARQTMNLHHSWQQRHQCNAGRKRETSVCCMSQNSFWQHEAKYSKLKCFLVTNKFSGFYLSPPSCRFL